MSSPHTGATHITRLLAEKHARDITVVECPLEPYGTLRADLWVMRPSWSKPLVSIYEVKVSRQDFLRDEKWQNYLPYCNAFSFAVAQGVLDPSELAEGVGLFELSKTGTMLRCVRKPHTRPDDHKALSQVTKAVLMNRVWTRGGMRIATSEGKTRAQRIAEWRETAESAEDVGRLMSNRASAEISKARSRERAALEQVETYKQFQAVLRLHGINPNSSVWGMERQLNQATGGKLVASLESVCEFSRQALDELRKVEVTGR